MTALVVDGKAVAQELLRSLHRRVANLVAQDINPCLVFVMIGESAPAEMYAKRLQRFADLVGIHVARHRLPKDITVAQLEDEIMRLNVDAKVDGILIQMPLPDHLLSARISTLLDHRKDVDAVTVENAGRLYLGLGGPTPSTASAMMHILDWAGVEVTGKHAVVVGRSTVVGHPVAELLLQRDVTLTVTHRQTADLAFHTRLADILMVAAGEPGLIQGDMIREGVVIVDAGINVTPRGVVGDVDFDQCKTIAAVITPVPGGVGPVTNVVLLRHVTESAETRNT